MIGLIPGITDIAALLALFGVNAAKTFGSLMENPRPDTTASGWSPFVFRMRRGRRRVGGGYMIYLIGHGSDVPSFV